MLSSSSIFDHPASQTVADNDRKTVVVHSGARDSYQVSLALQEAGLLDALVTDLYWPEDWIQDRAWARWFASRLPGSLLELVRHRRVAGLPARRVRQLALTGLRQLLLERIRAVPFSLRRSGNRATDAQLGRAAGRLARRHHAGLVTYSYYGHSSIRAYGAPAMLFQVHPHPATVRALLRRELAEHPECSASLEQEWELAVPEQDFQGLCAEPGMASHLLAASSFTRTSLIEHGIPAERIRVVPYGVDLERFHPVPRPPLDPAQPLRLLFVGRINQRKGILYLLEALRQFRPEQVTLTVCGRVVDGLELFHDLGAQVQVRPSVSERELLEAYQQADLFVFPSVAEGFGQVLLESLASGLPILSTTHTAAPDLITDGVEGFIVPPRHPDLLAERIRWALAHRPELEAMRQNARRCAERFPWSRFRREIVSAVREYLGSLPTE